MTFCEDFTPTLFYKNTDFKNRDGDVGKDLYKKNIDHKNISGSESSLRIS